MKIMPEIANHRKSLDIDW